MSDHPSVESMIDEAGAAISADDVGNVTRGKWRNVEMVVPAFVRGMDDVTTACASYYVTGGAAPVTAELREWAADGWDVKLYGGRFPTLRRSGVTVRWLHTWTGEPLAPAVAGRLFDGLTDACRRVAPGGRPLGSAGATGVDLWLRTLGTTSKRSKPLEYAAPSPALGEWIRSVSHQGRVEVLKPLMAIVPAVCEYDMRRAYLACLRELPAGRPYLAVGDPPAIEAYARGFVLVEWQAPNDWHRCGIFRQGRRYPLISDGAEWVSTVEYDLARRHGWKVRPHAAVLWPDKASPFGRWLHGVEWAREQVPPAVDRQTWRNVWRSIALSAIGALHGTPRTVTQVAPDGAKVRRQLGAASGTYPHPEWTSAIWARARVRLLDAPGAGGGRVGAWHLPAPNVIAFRTDAIYTTAHTGWTDDGALGRFRVSRVGGRRPWPLIEPDLLDGLHLVPEETPK